MKSELRKIIYILLGKVSFVMNKRASMSVLCYHGFSNDAWRFNTNISIFESQLEMISHSSKFITAKELWNYIVGSKTPSKPGVLLTIDDGYKDLMQIRKIVNSYKIRPIIFLLSDVANVNRLEIDNNKGFLSDADVRVLISDGWEIGSHGATHADFHNLRSAEVLKEVALSKIALENKYGVPVKYFGYPKGRYTKNVIREVRKAGYEMCFTMDDSIISTKTNLYRIPRIGVDKTHTIGEFPFLNSFYVIKFRQIVKKYLPSLAL